MNQILDAFSGGKTYAVMVGLIGYCIVQMVNKEPINEAIVYSLMGAGGMTMRAGIAKGKKAE